MDLGGLATLAGLAWPLHQRDDHKAALHLGFDHWHAVGRERVGMDDATRLPVSRQRG